MELDTHHLRLVRAVGETGSLSKAAVLLGISQPAVSSKLKRLETMLGQRLFDRCPSSAVVPTPIGDLLLRRVLAVLPLMEDLLHDIERRPSDGDRVRLGAVDAPVIEHLLGALARIRPSAEVSVISDECGELLLTMLVQHRVEVAVVKEYPGYPLAVPDAVAMEVIALDPTIVVLPPGHPLTAQDEIDLGDLREERWAIHGAGRFEEYFRATCRTHDFEPDVVHRVSSCAATCMAVRAGAVGLSQGVCHMHAGVIHRPLAGNTLHRRFLLAWREDAPIAKEAEALVEAARSGYTTTLTAALKAYAQD